MQNTRVNRVVDVVFGQLGRFFSNPWRRISLLAISVLFGFLMGIVISTIAGQQAVLDTTAGAMVLVFAEGISWLVYGENGRRVQSLLREMLNALKIGLTYSLFVQAFVLTS